MGFLIGFFLVWIPCGFYAAVVAGDKGHGGFAWFFGGLIFGPMALVAAAGLGDENCVDTNVSKPKLRAGKKNRLSRLSRSSSGKNDPGTPTHRSRSWTSWMTPWIQTRTAEVTAGQLR